MCELKPMLKAAWRSKCGAVCLQVTLLELGYSVLALSSNLL